MSTTDQFLHLPPVIVGPSHFGVRAPKSWAIDAMSVPAFRTRSRGRGIKVAVLDTGVDANHPAFAGGRILKAESFVPGENYADTHGHGTHCLGTVGANYPEYGVSQECQLLSAKVLDRQGSGADTWIERGGDWAIEQGAHILSMSLGSSSPAPRIQAMIQRAAAAGVLVVCAAGNSGGAGTDWPGNYVECINVAAFDQDGRIAPFSSRGDKLDSAAPGVRIMSARAGGGEVEMSGTSMATPFVAGVNALYFSALLDVGRPLPTVFDVRKLYVDRSVDAGAPGDDRDFGPGMISPVLLDLGIDPRPPAPESGPAGAD